MNRSIRDRLGSQHEAIAAIIYGLTDAQVRQKPAPEKWSIHDNIAHLALYQQVFLGRVHAILAGTDPVFDRYKAAEDPAFDRWLSKETSQLLEEIAADREVITELLFSLSETALAGSGHHPLFGRLDIPGWTEFFLLHEAHHMYTIFQLAWRPR